MFIIFSLGFIVIANLILGAFVFRSKYYSAIGKLFLLFTIFISAWLVTNALADSSTDIQSATFWSRITMFFGVGIPWLIFLFSLVFPDQNRAHKLSLAFSIPFVLTSILLFFTNLIVIKAERIKDIAEITFGPIGGVYGVVFLIYLVASLIIFFVKLRKSKGIARAQLSYLITGLTLTFLIGSITNLILPLVFNIYALSPFGAFSTLFIIAFTAYAIIAHQLFDIRVIIKRTVVYSGLLLFTLGIYSAVIFFFSTIFGGEQAFSSKSFAANMIAAAFIAIGFEPIRKYLTRVTDQYLFKGEYDPQAVLAKLSYDLSNSVDIQEAGQSLSSTMRTQMRLKHAAVIIFAQENNRNVMKDMVEDGYEDTNILRLVPENVLLQQFARSPQILMVDNLRREIEGHDPHNPTTLGYQRIINELDRLEAALALPIMVNNKAKGVFLVGEKLSGDTFTRDEVEFLSIAINQAATTIEKARFWEEDQMKSEFVSIASHELLTPTAAMKGYLSMILDDNMGEIDDTARGFLVKVMDSSNRLAKLVEDLLNVSRIEGGRLKVNKRSFSLTDSVKKAVDELQVKSKEKSLDLAFIEPNSTTGPLPNVYADPDHIYRVLVNLIGNSIKYTPHGWIRCFIAPFNHQYQTFIIMDSGLGIPKEHINHLFEKFYRADRKEISGIQGTGLGLYVSKKIIDLMGGELWVESEVGKGTTFYFTLPIAPSVVPITKSEDVVMTNTNIPY